MSKTELLNTRSQFMEQWENILAITERELTPEETQMIDDLKAKVDDIDNRLKSLETTEAEEPPAEASAPPAPAKNSRPIEDLRNEHARRQTRKVNPAPGYVRDYNDRQATRDSAMAFRGWCLGREATEEQRAAAHRVGLNLDGPLTVNLNPTEEQRAQSTAVGAGGYTIPQGFLAELEKKRAFFNNLRTVARVIRTSSGNQMPMPTVDDTGVLAAQVAENTATAAADFTVGQVMFGAYTIKSVVTSSLELLQDSGLNLGAIVGELLGERLGRLEAQAFAVGTGTNQPQGIVTGASAGKTTAAATAITVNELYDLVNSVDMAYQSTGAFMMNQSIWTYILKLQDLQGINLLQRVIGYAEGAQPMLFGKPVIINNNMEASPTTGKVTAIFGDFSKFYIRDAGPIIIRRSDDFLFTSNAAAFMATERIDSRVVQSAAIKKLSQA